MSHKEANLTELAKAIEYNILLDLYCRNNSGYRIELSQAIYSRFNKVFGRQLDSYERSKNEILNIYVESEGIDISKLYIDKVKELCESLDLNLIINPEYSTLKNHDVNKKK